jgi:signal transduction histidine kinase
MGLILTLQDVTYLRDQEARREQLMATLSHELRTPLTSLRMAVDLLGREGLSPGSQAGSLVEAAREDVQRLEDVAQRLLDVSRSRAMTIALERESVSLRDLAAQTVHLFDLQARERGISLETDLPADPLRMAGDATKLGWALSNLIGNALRYTPPGGVIRVEATALPSTIRIAVSDSGPGIPPEQRERIFERFAQGAGPGAAGLGLAIVRDVVQAHGGRIFLESEPGRGSRFILELPREAGSSGRRWRPCSSSTTRRTSATTSRPTSAGSATACCALRTRPKRCACSRPSRSSSCSPTCACPAWTASRCCASCARAGRTRRSS